jgi:hypothetical protein
MTRFPECAATDEGPGANYPSPTMGNFLKQLRESAGNPFRACVRASAKFHSRMAGKYGVDNPRGMAHYKLAEAFGNPTNKLQEFITKGGEFGDIPPKAVCKAHKDSVQYHKKQAEKAGLHTPMGHAHISAMAHHVDELNRAKQKMESQFGHTGRQSPVPGIPKKSEQPSQDIRQQKPLIKLKPRGGQEAGVKGMKWKIHRGLSKYAGTPVHKQIGAKFTAGDKWKVDGRIMGISELNAYLKHKHDPEGIGREAGSNQYVAQRYDQSHPEGFKHPLHGEVKPEGIDREADEHGVKGMRWGVKHSRQQRRRRNAAKARSHGGRIGRFLKKARSFMGFGHEARAFGRDAYGPVRAGGPGSGPQSSQGAVVDVEKRKPLSRQGQKSFARRTQYQKHWSDEPNPPKKKESQEKAPPGWEGTVKAMKKHKNIDNPWALAWSMKNKGDKSHKKESRSLESRRSEDGGEFHPITLAAEKPKLIEGWSGGAYSPPISRVRKSLMANNINEVAIKETWDGQSSY